MAQLNNLIVSGDSRFLNDINGNVKGSATKLTTDAGSNLNPVYFENGVPVTSIGNSIPFVVGTGTTAGTWLGTLEGLTEYYDGLLILYKSPVAGASTTTLNLNGLGAKTCYLNHNAKLTTHYPANQPILLAYSTSQNSGCFVAIDNYDSNSNTIGEYAGSCKADTFGMARYSLIMQTKRNGNDVAWESLVKESSTGTTKTKNTNGFLLDSPVLYQSAGTYAKDGVAGQSSCWYTISGVDARYSFNIASTWSAASRPCFIKGTINSTDNKFYLADSWWSDAYPTTTDGFYYIYVGQMYNAYCFTLSPEHPIFYYSDGLKVLINGTVTNAQTVNGHTVGKDVPSNAVFTDTTYTIATGDSNGQIKVTPTGGTAYNVSVKGLGSNAYTSTAYLPLTGETMTGKISWMPDSEDASNTGLYWKENGYGDKFAIYPRFAGSEDNNGLIIGGALGTSGTDPELEEFMSILPSGVVKIKSQSYTSDGLPTIDTSANNHYTSDTNYASGLEAVDANNWYLARFKGWANNSGDTAAVISARNYKTDGTLVQNNFNVKVKKDGSMTYEISSPSAFRSALDLGAAATHNTSGTYTSTGTEVFTRAGAYNLYNDVISANNRLHSMGYKKWMAANETQSNIAGSNGCGIIFSAGRMATYQVAGNAGSYAVTITAIGSGGAIGDWFTITCNATTGLLTVKNKSTAARYFVMIGAC